MAPGRKPPPWRRGQDGTRKRPRRGQRYTTGRARQMLFAASPLLLLVIGSLSGLTWGVVGVEAHVSAGERDGRGGLGAGSVWPWGTSSENEPSLQADKEAAAHHHQHQQRRRLQTSFTSNVILSESAVSVSEGGAGVTYTVFLDTEPDATVNVDISTASSEISISPAQLVFAIADYDDPQTVTVSAVDDNVAESLVEVAVTHAASAPDTANFLWNGEYIPDADLNVRVYDNDEAGVLVSASTLYVDETETANYNVKLMGRPSQAVTITAAASTPTYVTVAPTSITIIPADWDVALPFVVTAVNDDVQVAESYTSTISLTASSGDSLFDGIAPTFFPSSEVSVVIYDDDGGCYRTCVAGTWASPSNGVYECASCNPGYHCAGDCADPVACPAGTSRSDFGGVDVNDCSPCSSGYYASEAGSASCSECPAGYSCSSATAAPVACLAGTYASAGATGCLECVDGSYSALDAQESCQPCPAGHECPDKDSEPTRCSSGSYSSGNLMACEDCPAGYYCSSTGSSPEVCTDGSYSLSNWAYCVSCPPGQYCINTAQAPTECPAGSASSGGTTSCTPCVEGRYSDVAGATFCPQCPAGSSCSDRSAEPVPCTAGTFSQLGEETCSVCPAGTYSDEGASSCLSCLVGHSCFDPALAPVLCGEGYISGGGVSVCELCPTGTYTDSQHDVCNPCNPGYECLSPTLGQVLCDDGSYSTGGSFPCTLCDAGFFCISPTSTPQQCGLGTYSTSGSTECTLCPAGSECPSPVDLPTGCADGYYSAEGAHTCTICPAGEYCPGPPRDEASKAACPLGTYSEVGASSCSPCPLGSFCANPAQPPEACPSGFYADVENMAECTRCTAGNSCPNAAMPAQPCPEGYWSAAEAVSCTPCDAGFACPTTATGPIACSPGTFAVGLASNCTSCPPGYYCPNTESAEFFECPDGTYSTGDASSCVVCPAGSYCPMKTVEASLPCPDGYYSAGAATNCTACDRGFSCTSTGSLDPCAPGYFSVEGAMDCTACPAGYFCADTASDNVEPCPQGHYSTGLQQACTACQAGYYCTNPATAESYPCATGTYAVGGQFQCTDCPAGYTCSSRSTQDSVACGVGYYSLQGEPLCTPCPAGYRCPQARDSPIACNPGYYSTEASTNCTSCPAGYFCDDPEATPQPCEVGFYSGGGTAVCSACQPGYRCPEASVSATPVGSECPEGTYCNPARTLLECPAGTYGNTTAAASLEEGCQACTEGYYCTDTGNTLATRTICPAGYYCPAGSASATPCPAGTYNDLIGSWTLDVCAPCSIGHYCPRGSSSPTENVCPAGYYCPASTPAADSFPCPAGTYSANTELEVASECLVCTVGHYCLAGSTSPTACSPGTYNTVERSVVGTACAPCEPGYACTAAGMFAMTTSCAPGHFCPAGTSSRTQHPCPPGTYTDSTNLTSELQCSVCPERQACSSGSESNDWQPCGSGYYCPAGTPTRTSYPCSAGSFTNRTDLAADSECYPCPLGMYCGGSGSDTPDGPCSPGYYCPLRTAASTDYPCPAGTFSDSTSLYLETQCEDCPPGYYCPEAATTVAPCPAGTYSPYNATQDEGPGEWPSCTTCPGGSYCVEASVMPVPCGVGMYSDPGQSSCSVCDAGFYCGSNETSYVDMLTGAGSWDLASSSAGKCFNGTYCAAGMTRAPDLARDACPAGHVCPAGAETPEACPSGTYNPHTGMDDLDEDCLVSPAGYYTIEASTETTGACAPGYYCPAGSTGPEQVPCPARYYRNRTGAGSQDDCAYCVSGGYCPSGSTDPIDCPRGYYCVHGVSEPEPCPLGTYGNTTGLRKISDCKDCDPGSYCDQRGLTNPAGPCDPGYYCLDGSYTSAPNAPGSPLSIEDTDIGGLCPAGGYCPIGSSYQQPCPSGTYNNFSGAADPADCSDCPPGFYCSGTSNPAPTGGCDPGHYCTGGASSPTQFVTQAGYYAPVGAAQQFPCLPGSWNPETQQESCLSCSEGYYCPNPATTVMEICPLGRFCPAGSDVATPCPAGTFGDPFTPGLSSEAQCTNCTAGKYCGSNGLTEVSGDCLAGYYCTSGSIIANPSRQSYGDICPTGHYCEAGSPWPEPCPTGTYYGAEGNDGDYWANNTITGEPYRTYCALCPAGKACNATGLTSWDVLCAEGYFCKLGAPDPMPYCQAGEGLCTYGVCPAGHHCPTGTSDPIVCPPGKYMNNTGAAECFDCPERYYCDGNSPREYEECTVGHYCEAATDVPTNCPSGTFSNQLRLGSASECTACTPGFFCSSTGRTDVQGSCLEGHYCPSGSENRLGKVGAIDDHVCPAGQYCPAESAAPTDCPVGTYRQAEGGETVEDCTACSVGSYCETTGLVEPTGPCNGGYYCKRKVSTASPTSGEITVSDMIQGGDICPVATFCPNGTHTPQPCDAGTYNDLEGQDECFICPAGYYCLAGADSYDSSPCPAGHYCPEGTRIATEYKCPPGTYANETLTSSEGDCVDAPAGHYVSGQANTEVTGSCEAGYYCSGGASSATPSCNETVEGVCDTGGPCVAGQYCPAGSAMWRPCPGGSYCADNSGLITGSCNAAYYCTEGSKTPSPRDVTDEDGNIIGDICTEGHYCPEGSVTPLACPSGTYSGSTGNTADTACLPCTAGFICPDASTEAATEPCPAGYYCPEGTIEATLQCGVGQVCLPSSGQPVDCPAGTYQDQPGKDFCIPCPEGYYCEIGAAAPVDCPRGSYCLAETEREDQYKCPVGTFGNTINLANATECTACTSGSFCGTAGLDSPTGPCAAGYYCGSGATTATPDNSSTTGYQGDTCVDRSNGGINDLCPPGHYCPLGSGAPLPCPPGTASASVQLVDEEDCPDCMPGFYCPELGTYTATLECTAGFYCPGGDADPTLVCPAGHQCPTGSISASNCAAGTFQNETGQASCLQCPEGYYCPTETVTPFDCPRGSFCPPGTQGEDDFKCPIGTFGGATNLVDTTECTACTAGEYCSTAGQDAPTGPCAAGFYCNGGATTAFPDSFSATGYRGDTCVDRSNGTSNDLCPPGHYCPEGSGAPEPCPPGTASASFQLVSEDDCPDCTPGFYCPDWGTSVATLECTEGFFCPGGDANATEACPVGHHCPTGSILPSDCEAGTYQDAPGQESCLQCPEGYYCPTETETPVDCPRGSFCPPGTQGEDDFKCPIGTFGNTTNLVDATECTACTAGEYCSAVGQDAPTGPCAAGYYCNGGATTAFPDSFSATGYRGDTCVDRSNGTSNDLCPPGHYCPEGSGAPLPCPPGTASASFQLVSEDDCPDCTPGFYCPDWGTSNATLECTEGFFCPGGDANATEACPVGHHCPTGSILPSDCEAGTYQDAPGQESCLQCPEGYYCPTETETPVDCPRGSFCPPGTQGEDDFKCPIGTFGNRTKLVDATECTACTAGWYCSEAGQDAPTGPCAAGYYCNGGATTAFPDSSSSTGYQGDTCVDRSNGASNDLCPPGHYCPEGSGAPEPCPEGTASSSFQLVNADDCPDCTPGFYCPDLGTYNATLKCTEGYYCPGGDANPTNACPAGHYCPTGSTSPIDCVAGTYQNDTAAPDCDICPDRHYCETTATEAVACPAGFYCPEGTEFSTEFPCPIGTFSNETSLAAASECLLCPPGRFCGSEGLTEPEGLCGAGYYCALGATSPVAANESDPSVGGLCAAGYACVEGAESPQPVDGITGYECPQGTYCPAGSSFPLGCPPGTYNPSEAMEECGECLPGFICPGNTTFPEECPVYHFCPPGSATGTTCPVGTYGSRTDLETASECAPCPAGHYCVDGNVTSTCRAGYFCKTGIGSPTPNSELANMTYEEYNEVWEALDAGPCPAGHFCPPGTEDPVQCANASVRVSLLGVSADDCGSCDAGFVCFPGDPIPEQCPRGYYCPQGEDPVPCPIGTYNPLLEQDDRDDCMACPAGSFCYSEGIGDYNQYPCPAGFFCLMRETDPEDCPVGTYRNTTRAASVDDCHVCPGGFQCEAGSVTPKACPEKTYCPMGSSNTTTCLAGSYCPVETAEPIVCPGGYYCPLGSSDPIICGLGTYCPEGSAIFTSCPLGWYGSVHSNNTYGSRDEACAECPPGTYGADPDRLVCDICPGGYVCLGTTITATPTSIEEDGGFLCTKGQYCPEGSYEEIACAPGSYNSKNGSSAASDCIVCPADHYQDQEGSYSCLPCSSSSTSEANATACRCLGLNRAFQLSDGQCICRSGYEYYNEGGLLVSNVDGAIDCQPIVYERCYTGEALDADGICVSESDCDAQCGDAGGTFFEHIGLCECHGQQDLNAVCDVTCRDSSALMFVDPQTGLIVIVDGNSTEYVDPADLPSFAGALYCSDDDGCGLFPVTVSTNFSGVYGTGSALAAAVAEGSTASSAPNRRHRRLTTTVPLRDEEDGDGFGTNDDDKDEKKGVVRVRKDSGLDGLTSEQDMIDMFLRRRASNYIPRNQYRDRFFMENGTHTTIPGAIPKAQRSYTTPHSSKSQRQERDVQEREEAVDGYDVDDEEGFVYYGRPAWMMDVQERDQVKQSTWRRELSRRSLVGTDTEPAVESPLSCVSEGDAVIFDISSGCYPVYEKDSLLNSNKEFDYGEFREMAALATSSATYDTFAFVFEDAGTYVFSSSCNAASIIVVAVMGADVSCTTDAHFVPLTAANLIKLGVAKNADDITLTPDWALISGLLAGVAFMIFGVVSAVYYFRTKAWVTGQAATPAYRAKAQAQHLEGVDEPARQRPGFFTKRQNQVSPDVNSEKSGSLRNTLRSRLSISARTGGGFAGSRGEDIEMQSYNRDGFNAQDNPNVRELVDRMQKYHDDVEKEFTGQKDLVMKLHHLLQQEADELKRLLGAKAGVVGEQPAAAVEKSTRATLARLKTDLVSRRLHEAGVSTSEVEALSALKRLQELLKEGAEPFSKRVMMEISKPDIAGRGSTHDDAHASTPLLREIQEGAELIRVEVVDELGASLERERQREHAARTMLEGAVSKGGVVLPEDIVRTLKTMSEMDAKTDAGEREVASTLKRLADRLPACTQELSASEGLILRNLTRIRAMGNTSLETAEKHRGEHAIATVLDQLIQALSIVGARAEMEKAAVDIARIDAEVERRHLEAAVDESIKTLDIAGAGDGGPPATSDDLQGMLKEIRTLVSTTGSASAANAAVVAPTRRASAMFSQVAENEYRRHSVPYGDAADNSLLAEEAAEEEARRSEVEASLLAEQQVEVAAVTAVTESQKRSLEEELEHAGASAEEKQALMGALADDQKAIESILEGERIRMEESFRSAAAARKARDEQHAEEDAVEESQTKAELLHKQNAQIKELRRKHEAAQLAIAGAADGEGDQEVQGEEDEGVSTDKGADDDDKGGLVAALRKAHAEQTAMLESSLAAKVKSSRHALRERLAAQRAKREAELIERGTPASEAALRADKELIETEESQQQELAVRLATEKKKALKTEAVTQREVRDQARAAVKDSKDPTHAQRTAENEAQRIREQAVEAMQALEDAMAEEGRVRRKALKERLKAKRRAKEAELEKRGAGERERCNQDADLTCLEELEAEALEEVLQNEREAGLKEVRACAAAAEVAAAAAGSRVAGGAQVDPQAAVSSRKMKELHLAAMEKLERDLSRNEKNASRALKERLLEARAAREATLRDKDSLSASEAAKRARHELEDAEEKAQEALMEEMANDRIEAIGRANLEAEAAAAASMREEADRLLEEHRDRTAQLQEEMKIDAQRQKASLQKRLAARRQAADAIVAAARPVSQQAAAKAAALADFAEEAERNALETSLLDEASRMQSEADTYERLVQGIVTSAEEAASAAGAASTTGASQAGAEAAAEEASESLRAVHERAIAAMEVQYESKRRVAAGKLAQRKAAAKAARAEALRAAGKTEEEITKELAEEDVRDAQEAAQQDARLHAEEVAEIEEERATQIAAVADGTDAKKEAARIRERHIRDAAALEKELEQHCRDQRAALSSRLRKRKAAKEESLRRAGAGNEETSAAMQALEFEAERSAIQLEEALTSLKGAAITGEKQAAALASGNDDHPESSLAELRARHQESENLLKDSLRAEAGARRARTRQRIAARAAERAKELKALGRSEDEIKAEEIAIRAAGEAEQQNLEAVLATESEARIHAAREAALAAEAVLEARQEEARELRKNHEKAVAELKAEMAEKKRRGKEGVAAKLEERKAKRAAELKKSKARKEDVAAELARLDQESKEEEKRVEAELEEEAAMLAQAELKMLAKREAEARATQLTADNSRRAGEAELERIRREHEENQRTLEETQANKRKDRRRALTERLDRRRQEKINASLAAAESAENQQKLIDSLEQEKMAAVAELEQELVAEACNELEVHAQRQARAELAVRMSAQAAIEDAEKRAKNARDEHERSTKELDEQLAAAKISQGNKLRERLAKKRKDRESQLARENANAEAVKEARLKMETEEKREIARLDDHLAKERERLHAENLARATARRTREEAEERDRAAAAANAADLAKQEAVNCLQRLQKQHAEQHAALEHQMEEEKRSREGKLRDRLAKKRKAKEAEMEQAALSEREKQAAQKHLEEEERAERQRFHDQLEEETKKSVEAQRRHQEETLAAAAAEAARMTELAAAASARAAAADAVKEAVAAAEQDEFMRKAQKLKELSQANEEKERAALAGSSAATKSKLMERLAKKKAKAEAKRRELEAAQKMEEERLLAKHKEEVEAARAAAAPGWSGDIAWDEAVTVAMAEAPRNGETQSEREARVLKSVLEADIVPENKLGKCVELVMAGRHEKETAELLTIQYKERASRLATSLGKLLVDKNKARTEALQRLAKATEEEKAEATADVDDEFAGRQQQMETVIIQEMEPVHLEQQLELRQRQLQEIAGTFRSIAPESALKRLQEINAARQEEELQNFHAAMEREKEERLKRLQEEKAKFEEQLRQRHDAEMRRLQAEEDKVMDSEREAQEARLQEKQAELERQREEEKRKMEARSDQLNASQKEALLEKFKLDQAAELGALKAEEQSSKSKLEQKLAARRQKKTEELRKKEERQLKEKAARDAKRLQEIERQAKLEEAAEVGVLSASGSVSGLKVDIDQGAIQQAREAGGTNAAKERLKETIAANESRKMIQRHHSISGRGSISGGGGGATAAAAAAAATAATATAYTHISSKLEGIEALIAALKAAQGDSRLSAPVGAAGPGGSTQVYRDAEDAATIPEGDVLKVITREELPVQALARLEFGEHLLSVLGLADTVKLKVAKNLPPVATNANAFRNSYLWDMSTGVLHLHVRRLSSSGDFGLVLVHAAAHIQVDPSDTSNDLDPRFTQHFHRSLKVLTQELFKLREATAPAADGSLGSPRTRPRGSTPSRGKAETVAGAPQADGVLPKAETSGGAARSGEFAQDLIAERMEKYARASGHPRLVELLSRHASDQKDKFTLSDDEDQVSNVGDAAYMENYDNRDADSIFRSPIGSINGDASVDEENEEKKSYK